MRNVNTNKVNEFTRAAYLEPVNHPPSYHNPAYTLPYPDSPYPNPTYTCSSDMEEYIKRDMASNISNNPYSHSTRLNY